MKNKKPEILVIDVDGTMTNGQIIYSEKGKILKFFGPDDSDALNFMKKFMKIVFVSADKRGFKITKKRIVNDMKFKLFLVSTFKRYQWIYKKFKHKKIIYIGDGIFDHLTMSKVFYSIAPNNSFFLTKKKANFVTKHKGGDRAVAEAVFHILKKFFKKDITKLNV